jgi:asparagine synthase (glutamine-hydrolysing)
MCGICGITDSDGTTIRRMVSELHHRGPDDEGVYTDETVSLGNCRLKIIDLSDKGHQPMSNEDGSIWITFNGEIYNAMELRRDLEKGGHDFRSGTDTECIVHGYEEWRYHVVDRLSGMWAFCIYDSNRKILLLSRDRMGVKPLCYLLKDGMLAFSSELKVFTSTGILRRPLSTAGLVEQLVFGFNPSHRTMLDSVFNLGAGENFVYDLRSRKGDVTRYWDNCVEKSGVADISKAENLLDEAIRSHLISDVPVGCYLSGGIDSSVVALKYSERYSGVLRTFTVGFRGEDDETTNAKELSELIGSDHHELVLNDDTVGKQFSEMIPYYDLTLTDPAFIPNYHISMVANKFVKVVLAGEGGDEVFGGYPHYQYLLLAQRMIPNRNLRRLLAESAFKIPSPVRDVIINGLDLARRDIFNKTASFSKEGLYWGLWTLKSEGDYNQFLFGYLGQTPSIDYAKSFQVPWSMPAVKDAPISDIDHLLELDQRALLPEKYNYKADRSTSAASLEERVPLQDFRLVEYMNSLPNRYKFNETQEKLLLKAIVAPKLPQVARRKKRGYGTPLIKWMKSSLAPHLDGAIGASAALGILDNDRLEELHSRFRRSETTEGEGYFLWNVLVTTEGLRNYGYL